MTVQLAQSALAALERGSLQEAHAICADILQRDPYNASALRVMGNIYFQVGNSVAAEQWFERARDSAPRDVAILNALGGVYGANGKPEKARTVLKQALALDARYPWAHHNLAITLTELGERETAKRHYRAALRDKPDYAEAVAGLAELTERDHQLDEAESLAKRALSLSPRLLQARLLLARIELRRDNPAAVLARLNGVGERHAAGANDRALAFHLMGKAHEKLGQYEQAFSAFAAGNAILRAAAGLDHARVDGALSLDTVERMIGFVRDAEPAAWSDAPSDGRDPVFLVGFPRSGTTLLDQVLASHPDIETVEEQEGLDDALDPLLFAKGALNRWPSLSADEIAQFRHKYWQRSERRLNGSRRRRVFIDKMPLYTILLPLIYRLFPRAKILFAVRDPRDVVFSCFEQHFTLNGAMYQFLSLDTTVRYYDAVMRLGEVSRQRLPMDVHVVKYENVVGDFDATIAAALGFMGLAWDASVRNYSKTAKMRVVNTPSASQVIEPLYSSSIGRWQHYEAHLRPHLPALNQWARSFGYRVA